MFAIDRDGYGARASRAWSVEFRWKEEVIYWEGDHGYLFEAGWGVTPGVTYVPSADIWDAVVPSWMQGRRDKIVSRSRATPGHVLEDTDRTVPWAGKVRHNTKDS